MLGSLIRSIASLPANVRSTRLREQEAAKNNPHMMDALGVNKRQGQVLAIKARWISLVVIAILLPFINPNWDVLYFEALLVAFALLGWAQLKAAQVGQSRMELVLILLDLVLLTIIGILPNPLFEQIWPSAMQYRFENFPYFYVILAGATLAYSWRTLIAIGTWTSVIWLLGLVGIIFFGRTDPQLTEDIGQAIASYPLMLDVIDPNNVLVGVRIQEVVVFLIVAAILALNGWRNNQWMMKQASSERERENLARYFPPNIVDELADQDHPFDNIRLQPVAVLFADIVGFTRMAEQGNPEKVVEFLRKYHQLLETAVFENHGTLDKFLGDGIMATFGSPVIGPQDAANALQCVRDMVKSIDRWNAKRVEDGEAPVMLSIGVHYGDVILGDIGSERRLEFATLGDTVNVAARLEELTRSLGTQVIVSDELIEANKICEAGNDNYQLDNFTNVGSKILKGRESEIGIWKMQGL
ncbi:MAG: adenylate/guanylate cyclase domain-containing protein [Hyphomicrobiales bacterium]|nr:adenylate/guanylate cyclase domain-containing protein [Hyphomicrobiales bacterium]